MKITKSVLLALFVFVFLSGTECFAQVNTNTVWVKGYTKANGTHVQGHYRTAPNNTINDNFSTYPNVNPYTGIQGTIDPDPIISPTSSYNNSNVFESTPINSDQSIWNTNTYDLNTPTYTPITTPSINIWDGGGGNR